MDECIHEILQSWILSDEIALYVLNGFEPITTIQTDSDDHRLQSSLTSSIEVDPFHHRE